MVRLYCDRCGKEVERSNEMRYKPIEDAANGEDTFFVIDVYRKHTYDQDSCDDDWPSQVDGVGEEIVRYHFITPDLCIDCKRKMHEAVKTVWDGIPYWKKKEAQS